jgi:hypothetical protein
VSAARQDGLFCEHSRVQVAAPMRVGHGFRRVSCASRAISKIAIERLFVYLFRTNAYRKLPRPIGQLGYLQCIITAQVIG